MKEILGLALLGWAVAFFGSFILYYLTPASEDGLAGGLEKVATFLKWQGVATMLALACLVMRWSTKNPVYKVWAAIPAMGFGLVTLGFGVLFFWAKAQTAPAPIDTDLVPKVIEPVDG